MFQSLWPKQGGGKWQASVQYRKDQLKEGEKRSLALSLSLSLSLSIYIYICDELSIWINYAAFGCGKNAEKEKRTTNFRIINFLIGPGKTKPHSPTLTQPFGNTSNKESKPSKFSSLSSFQTTKEGFVNGKKNYKQTIYLFPWRIR